MLHNQLERNALLTLFFKFVNKLSHGVYFKFQHADFVFIPKQSFRTLRYHLSFRLMVNDYVLGDCFFCKRIAFDNNEINGLEKLVSALILPLKNSEIYEHAKACALKDPLTGTANRSAFNITLKEEIKNAKQQHCPLSVLVIDIDDFKKFNDKFGHAAGDKILKVTTDQIIQSLRKSDCVFRIGGEEFFVTLLNTDKQDGLRLAKRIRKAIASIRCHYQNHTMKLTVSIGFACLGKQDNLSSLFNKADNALYQAKEKGGNQVCAFRLVKA